MSFSTADFLAMQARCDRSRKVICENIESPKGASRESQLHEEIISHCKSRGWIYFHGSMAVKTSRTVGENDFHCLLPGGIVLFIECKTKTGKLSAEQLGMKMWMESQGHTMHIVRSIQEFQAIAASALSGNPTGSSKSFPAPVKEMENTTGSASASVVGKQ